MPGLKQVLVTAGAMLVAVTAISNFYHTKGSLKFPRNGVVCNSISAFSEVLGICDSLRNFVYDHTTKNPPTYVDISIGGPHDESPNAETGENNRHIITEVLKTAPEDNPYFLNFVNTQPNAEAQSV